MQAFRSALFNLFMVTSAPVYALASLFTVVLPFSWRYAFISRWARMQIRALKWFCRLDYRVEGREHIPGGAAIIMAKHQSTWETFAFQAVFPPHVWVLKRELMWVPFFGWALSLLKPIAIDRGSGKQAMAQLVEQGRARLDAGLWVIVFPEGTRIPPGMRGRYRLGGAVLAAQTGYPVVPVAHNAGSYWPRRGFTKHPGTIDLVIGPVIPSKGRKPEAILDDVQDWIETTMQRLEGREGPARLYRRS